MSDVDNSDTNLDDLFKFEDPTPEEQAHWEYLDKCQSLCTELGLKKASMMDCDTYSAETIIEFLRDEEKLKRALFILKHLELL